MTEPIQFRRCDDRDADAVWRLHEQAIRATGNDPSAIPGTSDLNDELHRMRVAPSQQRRGYGRSLLHKLERQVADRGYEVLLATTSQSQPAAVAFYRDEGYHEVSRSTQGEYELVHFEKRL